MAVTKLTIKKSVDYERDEIIFDSFLNQYEIDLLELTLSKNSDCGQYQVIYTFFSEEMVDSLIDLFIEYDIIILKREDCSVEIVNFIINDELDSFKNEFDYTLDFDNIMESFSKQEIVLNAILDKICTYGKESLTDYQISILKNVA